MKWFLPLNKYNLEDLSNTKFYKNITGLGKTTLSMLDFQNSKNITFWHRFLREKQ